ncbi:vegetative cell wall protein gp1-like [Cryptomeria japonica]|uniref:vegetative cell wall protein gp1-like n=1 Tax=Cryptomeria japonica TaxID=3369 RepID=UPI0027DA105C|nr:vegetative cell wall protein gp1-like [Cryptomeria japonica]
MEEGNPRSEDSTQDMEDVDTILNVVRNSSLEMFNFQKWVVDNITNIQEKQRELELKIDNLGTVGPLVLHRSLSPALNSGPTPSSASLPRLPDSPAFPVPAATGHVGPSASRRPRPTPASPPAAPRPLPPTAPTTATFTLRLLRPHRPSYLRPFPNLCRRYNPQPVTCTTPTPNRRFVCSLPVPLMPTGRNRSATARPLPLRRPQATTAWL